MSFIFLSSVVSLVLVGLASVVGLRLGFGKAALVWLIALVTSLFLFSPVVLLQSFLSLLAIGLCALVRIHRASIMVASALALLLSYWMVYPAAELKRLAELRERYPLVSLAERLSYEAKHAASPATASAATVVPLSAAVEQQLEQFEAIDDLVRRRIVLERLHDRTSQEFVIASGFGNSRMGRISPSYIELPETKPIPLPYMATASSPLGVFKMRDVQLPAAESLSMMHTESYLDFLDRERLGYVRDRRHVAGFISHRLTKVPKVETPKSTWQVARLELVSILKHDPPVAYIATHLPNMDQLRHAGTRPLDSFESDVLARLRGQEDVVSAEGPDRIRMLGSLRASQKCLECHTAKRGELLGAFSYDLRPLEGPIPARENTNAQVEPAL